MKRIIIIDDFKDPEENEYELAAQNILDLYDGNYDRAIKSSKELVEAMFRTSYDSKVMDKVQRVVLILQRWQFRLEQENEEDECELVAQNVLDMHDGDHDRAIKMQEEMIGAMRSLSATDMFTRTLRNAYQVLAVIKKWRDDENNNYRPKKPC